MIGRCEQVDGVGKDVGLFVETDVLCGKLNLEGLHQNGGKNDRCYEMESPICARQSQVRIMKEAKRRYLDNLPEMSLRRSLPSVELLDRMFLNIQD